MKLSWLSTSEAHKHTSMYMISNMNQCTTQIKRERVQSQWIKRKQQDLFRGSSTELYVPAFTTVKGFHYIHRGNYKGLPKTGVPNSTNYKRSTEDRSTELPPIQSSTEEGSQHKEGYNKVVYLNHKPIFPQIKILQKGQSDIAQVWKSKCLEIKNPKKTIGKTLDRIDNENQINSQRISFSK